MRTNNGNVGFQLPMGKVSVPLISIRDIWELNVPTVCLRGDCGLLTRLLT